MVIQKQTRLLYSAVFLLLVALAVVPTWYIGYAMHWFLPKKHPWRYTFPTYTMWVKNATWPNFCIGLLFWSQVVPVVIVINLLRG
jgi:hypothetical protein